MRPHAPRPPPVNARAATAGWRSPPLGICGAPLTDRPQATLGGVPLLVGSWAAWS
jgi:hypothetical protein